MAKRSALVTWGGWEGHTPKACADVFAPFLAEQGFDVRVSDTLDTYLDPSYMNPLSLIVPIWTMSTISGEQLQGLNQAVQSGVGLAGFHGGIIDSFRQNTGYQFMTGGQWVDHPGGIIPQHDVHIVDRDHEITRGISDFKLTDTEQYYVHIDPAIHVLAETTFTGEYGDASLYQPGTVVPYAWTKTWGKGRVFVAAWGHTDKDFDNPPAKEIVERGMLWASR